MIFVLPEGETVAKLLIAIPVPLILSKSPLTIHALFFSYRKRKQLLHL